MSHYYATSARPESFQIPLNGEIAISYRCNNKCRHCWVCLPVDYKDRKRELAFEEIVSIVKQARVMGCRSWSISGGEPMIREDFVEIYDYIAAMSTTYTLNTNGTLITPKIARSMKRAGTHLVSLYGATADVHDHVTRNPGSYEAAIRGMRYLKEAGVNFRVLVVPMADNEHQFEAMCSVAESLGNDCGLGVSWLRFTAWGDKARNEEIARQRISPHRMLEINKPSVSERRKSAKEAIRERCMTDDRVFARCVDSDAFRIDPYGTVCFCEFIRDPALRFDLRRGSFEDYWDAFRPTLADRVRGGQEYADNCQACELQSNCLWCPAIAYLEHGRYSAKVTDVCNYARERDAYDKKWSKSHCSHFELAGITIRVESDLPITSKTFHRKFGCFRTDGSKRSDVVITHHFEKPIKMDDLGEKVFSNSAFTIFKRNGTWIYVRTGGQEQPDQVLLFSPDYSQATVYNSSADQYLKGNLPSLTMLAADQLVLSHLLAYRGACYFHCSAASIRGNGYLFVGHSKAGKSTIATMLDGKCEVVGEEHTVVRQWPDGLWVHGSWNHNRVRFVTAAKIPLKGIFFLDKAPENRAESIEDRSLVIKKLLAHIIRPLETREWWQATLLLLGSIAGNIPCYILHFNKDGKVFDVINEINESLYD